MADIILALAKKRSQLYERTRAIQAEANRQISEISMEIAEIDKALETLNEAIKDYICPNCNGSGSVRVCDAAGQMEDDTCPVCHGTGVFAE